jgi:hypothetical protein
MSKNNESIQMPFSGHTEKELRFVVDWLANIDKEHGLGNEALDAFLSEYLISKDWDKAIWFANCEWDL